jgi:hypothetical protein
LQLPKLLVGAGAAEWSPVLAGKQAGRAAVANLVVVS